MRSAELIERVRSGQLGTAFRRKMRTVAGDRKAVGRVELVLSETGVCNRSAAPGAGECCGGPALSAVDACCAADANAEQDKTGCGCPS
jgi:hypothetical protein